MAQNNELLSISIGNELTMIPLAGAALVNEILKSLLYQKCQIPYPFHWLKTLVEKRRKKLMNEENSNKKVNITYENHYRIVSNALDYVESVTKSIKNEFRQSEKNSSTIEEICILFGSNPNCIKEAFSIEIPTILEGHNERIHLHEINKYLQKILRDIFLSEEWMNSSSNSTLACTNTYVYLKKKNSQKTQKSDHFEFTQPPYISHNIKYAKLKINYECPKLECACSSEEEEKETEKNDLEEKIIDQEICWYRFRGFLNGFKECYVNKVSVTELW